ncbi:ROK family protein [Streptomyces sp. CB02923]|uniref:ROK family protein n=1 Tax=Streptomyces sp. CB02923 TaxID=1718985 RepID=UPI0009A1195B|nr:ROK family protein [Streptomyces sp. CB02923]
MTDPDRNSRRQAGAADTVLTLPGSTLTTPGPGRTNGGPGGVTLGLDIGGTLVKSALVAPDGTVRHESRCPTRAADGPEAVLRTVLGHAATALAAARAAGEDVRAVGVASCGLVDEDAGTVVFSASIQWRDLPLRRLVAEHLGLPVALGHDVRSGGLAEARLGAGRGHRVVLFVPVGTGVGGALLLDGQPFPGSNWRSAEVGHVVTRPDGTACPCGQRGCLDTIAGGVAIARRYNERRGTLPPVTGAQEVARRAAAGDPAAVQVWGEAADAMAQTLLAAITLFDPAVLVLGGGLSQAGEQLRAPLRRGLEERAAFQALPDLVFAQLGERAGRIGAGLLAWDLLPAREGVRT